MRAGGGPNDVSIPWLLNEAGGRRASGARWVGFEGWHGDRDGALGGLVGASCGTLGASSCV